MDGMILEVWSETSGNQKKWVGSKIGEWGWLYVPNIVIVVFIGDDYILDISRYIMVLYHIWVGMIGVQYDIPSGFLT